MCGIAGACWSPAQDVPALEKRLSVSISAMHNRGPDSAGQVSWTARDGHGWSAAIGSTRLAVLDLSPAGRQPMSTPDGRYSLVYNGEITNYVELRDELGRDGVPFSSGSDTEVLLAA
ncbi:MAG: hypothetical protein QG661_2762, partial [Actinomycetota bacterium]|nr:hypothetical protein [Actinomycetota bacterium]